MSSLRDAIALALGCAVVFALPALGQPNPNGPEFQVNAYTTGRQWFGDVASLPDGEFAVAWSSDGSFGTDQSATSIQARRWSASGSSPGDEFQVNAYTSNEQFAPAVASDGLGRLVVAWASLGSSGSDIHAWSIQAQRFSAAGTPEGAQFQVNNYTSNFQEFVDVTADANGNFVVAWQSSGSYGTDDFGYSVQARRYSANGTALGTEFQVNSLTSGDQGYPSIAATPGGGFIVAWTSAQSNGSDSSATSVQARVFDSEGDPSGDQFQVNTYTTSQQGGSAIGVGPNGDFVVAWGSYGSAGSDQSGFSVQAQRFSSTGSPLGPEFQVNTYTTNDQNSPAVAVDGEGNFVIVWRSEVTLTTEPDLRGRRYRADGTADGIEFQINSYTSDSQSNPSISSAASGDFVVAFSSIGSSGNDADDASMQARRFDALFRDGFEGGGFDRWSMASP